jgi:hypothetical protein
MDKLVAGLPLNETGDPHFMDVINNLDSDDEGNVCTKRQVAAAKARGWTPRYMVDAEWREYEGCEDDFVLGDVNGDGRVDVSDYIGVANHILNIPQAGFNEQAADVDGSGTIDVSDYLGIGNIIHTGSPYGAASRAAGSRRR